MIDELIKLVREGFKSIKDHRGYNSTYSLPDLLSAGFAIFSLKDPSLLAFREQFPQRSENLKRIYGIERLCCMNQPAEPASPNPIKGQATFTAIGAAI